MAGRRAGAAHGGQGRQAGRLRAGPYLTGSVTLLPNIRKGQQPLQFNPTSDGGRAFRLRFPGKGRNVKGAMTRSGAGIRTE
jgi:hypothetical protein